MAWLAVPVQLVPLFRGNGMTTVTDGQAIRAIAGGTVRLRKRARSIPILPVRERLTLWPPIMMATIRFTAIDWAKSPEEFCSASWSSGRGQILGTPGGECCSSIGLAFHVTAVPTRSATRSFALRLRGLFSTSASLGRSGFFVNTFHLGSSRKAFLTMRSSSE